MTYQEHQDKVQELVDSFKPYVKFESEDLDYNVELNNARQCAHIAIDREINMLQDMLDLCYDGWTLYIKVQLSDLKSIKELIDTTV